MRVHHEWHDDWIVENYWKYKSTKELANEHNRLFGTDINKHVFAMHCVKYLNLRRAFTKEQEEWLEINYPIMGTTKATEEFNKTFNTNRSWDTIRTHCSRKGIKCNSDVRSAASRKNAKRYVPIGTITEDSQGYLHIKTGDAYGKRTNNWELYHRWVWEQENGKVPDDCYLIFLDGDKTNCDISNLALIPKGYITLMMKYKLKSSSKVITETAIKWCELYTIAKQNNIIDKDMFWND